MCLPKETENTPLSLSGGHAEKTWSYFIGCKIKVWSTAVFELLEYGSLTQDELPHLKHVVNPFASLLRQSCAVKYFGLMRRARGLELGRQGNMCETAKYGAHFRGRAQHFYSNCSAEEDRGRAGWITGQTDLCGFRVLWAWMKIFRERRFAPSTATR